VLHGFGVFRLLNLTGSVVRNLEPSTGFDQKLSGIFVRRCFGTRHRAAKRNSDQT